MKKDNLIFLVAILGATSCKTSPNSHSNGELAGATTNQRGDPVQLKAMIAGTYEVRNPKCSELGESIGNKIVITVVGKKVQMRGSRLYVEMFDGSIDETDEDGNKGKKSGILLGNGFLYGEEVRNPNGTRILSKVEYGLLWESNQLHFTKTTRINADHYTKNYCDLNQLSK